MRPSRHACLPVVLVGAALAAGNPAAAQEPPGDIDAGIDLAVEVCGQCHGIGFEEESPHFDAPTFYEIAQDPAVTGLSLRVFLQTPHRQMLDLHLSEQETDDVIAYILSLKE